jgi:ribonuclease HII
MADLLDLVPLMAESYRLRLLRGVEEMLFADGYRLIAGVDEAGRGCLAGPVVAAAVVCDPVCLVPGVDDSKKLPPEERGRIATCIRSVSVAVSWNAQSASIIDRINILEATRRAMLLALDTLPIRPEVVLVDAVKLPWPHAPCLPIIRGDAISYAVASASIVAKTERDRLMEEYDHEYPEYDFGSNKGYGAPRHLEALATLGPSPIHRLTFRSVLPRRSAQGVS